MWDTFITLGQQALERHDLEQAQQAFTAAVAECEAAELGPSSLALSLNNLAAVFHRRGYLEEAVTLAERALAALAGSPWEAEMGLGLLNLAKLYLAAGRWTEAEAALLSAGEKLDAGPDSVNQKELLGQLYLQLDKLPQAAQLFQALAIDLGGMQADEDLARILHTLSNVQEALGQPQEAERSRQECLRRLRSLWVESPAALAEVLSNMADSIAAAGSPRRSLAYVAEALETVPSDDIPSRARLHLLRLTILREAGQTELATSEGAALATAWAGEAWADYRPRLQAELGLCSFMLKDYSQASQRFRQVLESPRTREDVSFLVATLYNLASAQQGMESLEDADSNYSRALQLASAHLPQGHSLTARIVWNYATLLESLNQGERATRVRQKFGLDLGSVTSE